MAGHGLGPAAAAGRVGMLVVAALASTADRDRASTRRSRRSPSALFIAFGELLRLALPGGREAAPIAMAGALAYALLLRRQGQHPLQPRCSTSARCRSSRSPRSGMTIGALPHVAAGRPAGLTGMCTRLVAVACVAFIFRPLAAQPPAISAARALVDRAAR